MRRLQWVSGATSTDLLVSEGTPRSVVRVIEAEALPLRLQCAGDKMLVEAARRLQSYRRQIPREMQSLADAELLCRQAATSYFRKRCLAQLHHGCMLGTTCALVHEFLGSGAASIQRIHLRFDCAVGRYGASPYRALLPDAAAEVVWDRTTAHEEAIADLHELIERIQSMRNGFSALENELAITAVCCPAPRAFAEVVFESDSIRSGQIAGAHTFG